MSDLSRLRPGPPDPTTGPPDRAASRPGGTGAAGGGTPDARPARPAHGRRGALARGWQGLRRRLRGTAPLWLLGALTLVIAGLILADDDMWPYSLLVLPLVLGNLYVGPRHLPWFVVAVLSVLAALVPQQRDVTFRVGISIVMVFVLGFIIILTSLRRSRLGVAGVTGESMFVDLRDRIQSQGQIPALPPEWYVESALRSAGGTPFAGDFLVAGLDRDGTRLSLCVVDVSGKGTQAGTRSLLLSGAFGGLLGAMSPERFLPAANDYLMRQQWTEGFATAVHLALDLSTGDLELRTAGHPPAVQLHAGSGRWLVHDTEGPILGLLDDAEFTVSRGVLRPGDALLLYTDGLVETRDRDLASGIDKLVGEADRLLRGGFEQGAAHLIDRLGSANDDRALVLVHRRG